MEHQEGTADLCGGNQHSQQQPARPGEVNRRREQAEQTDPGQRANKTAAKEEYACRANEIKYNVDDAVLGEAAVKNGEQRNEKIPKHASKDCRCKGIVKDVRQNQGIGNTD